MPAGRLCPERSARHLLSLPAWLGMRPVCQPSQASSGSPRRRRHRRTPCSLSLPLRPVPMRQRLQYNAANPLGQDRKSTRLNSSHVEISYAVFCLKKKKKKKGKKREKKKKKKKNKKTKKKNKE